MIIYLSKDQLIKINRETVRIHGGNYMPPFNFLHESNLDYLIDSVSADLFGSPMYPAIADKAALYCHSVICNHIFSDGNKRTGLGAGLQFLNLNGYKLSNNVTNEILTQFILDMASGRVSLEECKVWFEKNIVLIRE